MNRINSYTSKLEGLDINKEHKKDSTRFNTPHSILAHLVWTEHFLIIKGLANKSLDIPWLEEYMIGTNPDDAKTKMTFEELMKYREDVHKEAMDIISNLTDKEIDEPNYIEAKFGGV